MTDARALPPPADENRLAAFRRWWGDHALAQAIGLAAAAVILAFLASNVVSSMRQYGMSPSFDYLTQPANFDISESLIVYRAGDFYGRAILVGLLNTIKLAVSGCALATVLGVTLGVMRAAGNPLLERLVAAYVEVVRNTPLVLQLFFWIALTHTLPSVRQSLQPLPYTYLSVRGVYLPWVTVEGGAIWPIVAFFILLAWIVHAIRKRLGRPLSAFEWLGIVATVVIVPVGWIYSEGVRLAVDWPVLKGFNIVGGISLTPEFAAMLVGLSVYYAANIAEIVRSGLQSVTTGQWEAGRALGLHRTRCFSSSSCRRPCG